MSKSALTRLWHNFELLARMVHNHGGTVAIEWPRSCAYLQERRVKALIKELNLANAGFDGCALGLKSEEGVPIVKPWITSTNHEGLY